MDCAQLVKANSIEGLCVSLSYFDDACAGSPVIPRAGNKRNNISIIYTPWSNIKKTGDMAVGSVTFHNEQKVGSKQRDSISE